MSARDTGQFNESKPVVLLRLKRALSFRGLDLLLACAYLLMCGAIDWAKLSPIDIDSHSYVNLARGMQERAQFLVIDETGATEQSFVRTPGYSIFLAVLMAALGQSFIPAATWIQRMLWAWLIAWMLPPCAGIAGARRLMIMGKCLALFLPIALVNTSMLLAETLYTVTTFLAIQLVCTRAGWWRAIAAGALFGCATLIRPVGLWVPVLAVATIALFSWRHALPQLRAGQLVLALCIALAIPAGWMLRVKQLTGNFALTSLNGPTFALNRQEVIERLSSERLASLPAEQQTFVREVQRDHDVYWAVVQVRRKLSLDEFTAANVARDVAKFAVATEPLNYLATVARNLVRTFTSATEGLQLLSTLTKREWSQGTITWLLLRILQPVLLLVLPGYLLIRHNAQLRDNVFLVVMLVCGAYLVLAPALLTISYGRFLFPVLPAIALIYSLPGREKESA